jgi:D-alanyl-D-alanine carboxypeptidase
MQNEEYKKIVSTTKYVCKSNTKSYVWKNKNKLLTTYEYTTGGKTGFTKKARRTLVSTASKDNKNIVVVSLNDPDDWSDHKYLYESIFKNYNNELILDKNNFKIANETYYKDNELYIKDDVYILLNKNEKKDITLDYNLKKLTFYKNNECVGTVKIKLKDDVLKEVNIYVRKETNKSENKKSLIKKIMGWFKRDK